MGKSRFFIYRLLTYFSFLLIPVWVPKLLTVHKSYNFLIIICYQLFMIGQWYLLGKEIDHRLKIYFRVNSTIDRILYRLLSGYIFLILLFNLYSLLPDDWIKHFFWGTWIALGLFYSWPTRGKIIRESVSSQMSEYQFLDSFEKTLLSIIVVMFVVSLPEIPNFDHPMMLRDFLDPVGGASRQIWNFLEINFHPFRKYPGLMNLGWSFHFYTVGCGFLLVSFYALARFYFGRRLALLGAFSILSSWSFSKLLGQNMFYSLSTTFSLIWIWSHLWVAKSSTYRTGLFLGLITYYGTLINETYFFSIFITLIFIWKIFSPQKTLWFKKQVFRYASFGIALSIFTFFYEFQKLDFSLTFTFSEVLFQIRSIYDRKAFFSLSLIGMGVSIYYLVFNKVSLFFKKSDEGESYHFVFLASCFLSMHLILNSANVLAFTLMWLIALFSLMPIELIFQSMSRLRSKRNMIFLIYILVCLLDSHFEGRVKILLKTLF